MSKEKKRKLGPHSQPYPPQSMHQGASQSIKSTPPTTLQYCRINKFKVQSHQCQKKVPTHLPTPGLRWVSKLQVNTPYHSVELTIILSPKSSMSKNKTKRNQKSTPPYPTHPWAWMGLKGMYGHQVKTPYHTVD